MPVLDEVQAGPMPPRRSRTRRVLGAGALLCVVALVGAWVWFGERPMVLRGSSFGPAGATQYVHGHYVLDPKSTRPGGLHFMVRNGGHLPFTITGITREPGPDLWHSLTMTSVAPNGTRGPAVSAIEVPAGQEVELTLLAEIPRCVSFGAGSSLGLTNVNLDVRKLGLTTSVPFRLPKAIEIPYQQAYTPPITGCPPTQP